MSRLRKFSRVVSIVFALSLVMASIPLVSVAQEATPSADCPVTTPEENAETAILYRNEVVQGKDGTVHELLSPDVVYHWSYDESSTGLDEFYDSYNILLSAFPDIVYDIEHVVADGDYVALYWTLNATHRGEWRGIAPTDREVSFNGANFFRFECGVIAEAWGEANHPGLLAQLGAPDIPAWLATPAAVASTLTVPEATPCAGDSTEANLELARRWSEEIWTGQQLELLDEILHPNAVHHGASFPDVQGPGEIADAIGRQLEAFPDLVITIEDAIASGDLVAVRWSATGTQEGEYLGLEPTGNAASMTGINIYRINCGQVVESWSEMNSLDILRELRDSVE